MREFHNVLFLHGELQMRYTLSLTHSLTSHRDTTAWLLCHHKHYVLLAFEKHVEGITQGKTERAREKEINSDLTL